MNSVGRGEELCVACGQVERRPEVPLGGAPTGCVASSRPSLPRVKILRKACYGGEGDDKEESIKASLGQTPCPTSCNSKAAHPELKCGDAGGGTGGRQEILWFGDGLRKHLESWR